MTAEIGVLNTNAVALAADSAVTIGSSKVFNTADKLFALSKYHPVGIMIYGNATFMGVPWETVIKVFRKQLGSTTYDTLDEYCSRFFDFIKHDRRLLNAEYEIRFIQRKFSKFMDELLVHLNNIIPQIFASHPSEENVLQMIFAESSFYRERFEGYDTSDGFEAHHFQRFYEKYAPHIDEIIKSKINFEVDSETFENFLSIACCIIMKDMYVDETGIVIAGFGDTEIFPSLKSYLVEGIFDGVLKYKQEHDVEISAVNTGVIVPFAQQEMVHSFLTGIDPDLKTQIIGLLEKMANEYPKVIDGIVCLSSDQKEEVRNFGNSFVTAIVQHIDNTIREKYSGPVVETVASLPKEELAAMAEALVNLTSIKRKMSNQTETVGGPTDVAVISKGDGFIWIKRKHYFSPELNHNYFTNYLTR